MERELTEEEFLKTYDSSKYEKPSVTTTAKKYVSDEEEM